MRQTELVREIPVKQILALTEVQLRELDKDHMEVLRGLYEEEAKTKVPKLPPIEVCLLQSGDPKTALYPLYDGFHRFTVQREMNRRTVLARVRHNTKFTTADMTSKALLTELLFSGLSINAKNPRAFTKEERRLAVIRCNELYGMGAEKILETGVASRATIYRWLKDVAEKKKEEKQQIERRAQELSEKGLGQRAILTELRKDEALAPVLPRNLETLRSTVRHAIDTDRDGVGGVVKVSDETFTTPLSQSKTKTTLPGSEDAMTAETVDRICRVYDIMEPIYDSIRNAPSSEEFEEALRTELIPLLCAKFSSINALVHDTEVVNELSSLRADYTSLIEQNRKAMKKNGELDEEVKALKHQIDTMHDHCKEDCSFTYVRLHKEVLRFLDFLKERAKEHADLLPHYKPELQKMIKQLAYGFVVPSTSMFEWIMDHGTKLTTPETLKRMDEFEQILREGGLINSLISKRFQNLRERARQLRHATDQPVSEKEAATR